MKIGCWNINSVRLRIENIAKLLHEQQLDILCLQETKVTDDLFPFEAIHNMGYPYIEARGEKSYNGVAIISKIPLHNINYHNFTSQHASRHISAYISSDVELHNFYVPAGGDIPDPKLNPAFASKLSYLDQMSSCFTSNYTAQDKLILVGDINIAPLEHDVWSHKQLLKVVSHTPIELEKIAVLQKTLDWQDAIRKFVPAEEKLYSWWSYRNQDWRKSNRGRRLDHIWTTPPLISKVKEYLILKDARDWHLPSDHVPVIIRIDL